MKDGLRMLYDVLTKIMIVMGAMAILVTVLASISAKNWTQPIITTLLVTSGIAILLKYKKEYS
jgi:uncharacterized membrane-anchored protein